MFCIAIVSYSDLEYTTRVVRMGHISFWCVPMPLIYLAKT
jgi:hypothetical protein